MTERLLSQMRASFEVGAKDKEFEENKAANGQRRRFCTWFVAITEHVHPSSDTLWPGLPQLPTLRSRTEKAGGHWQKWRPWLFEQICQTSPNNPMASQYHVGYITHGKPTGTPSNRSSFEDLLESCPNLCHCAFKVSMFVIVLTISMIARCVMFRWSWKHFRSQIETAMHLQVWY